jgi:hypothetical protein
VRSEIASSRSDDLAALAFPAARTNRLEAVDASSICRKVGVVIAVTEWLDAGTLGHTALGVLGVEPVGVLLGRLQRSLAA